MSSAGGRSTTDPFSHYDQGRVSLASHLCGFLTGRSTDGKCWLQGFMIKCIVCSTEVLNIPRTRRHLPSNSLQFAAGSLGCACQTFPKPMASQLTRRRREAETATETFQCGIYDIFQELGSLLGRAHELAHRGRKLGRRNWHGGYQLAIC